MRRWWYRTARAKVDSFYLRCSPSLYWKVKVLEVDVTQEL